MGTTKIEQPTPPAAPTTAQNMADYVNNYPAMMALEQKYNPEQAQLQYDLTKQFTPQYADLMKQTNESLYPGLAKLNETLTAQAQSGMESAVPESMKAQYLNQLRSEIGPNAGSGIGADYVSRNLINQGEQYKNYYQNMALSLTGRQPLTQAQSPAFQNVGDGYNFGQVAGNNMQGYGSYSSLYGNMYGANASQANARTQGMYGLLGAGMQAGGSMFAATQPTRYIFG